MNHTCDSDLQNTSEIDPEPAKDTASDTGQNISELLRNFKAGGIFLLFPGVRRPGGAHHTCPKELVGKGLGNFEVKFLPDPVNHFSACPGGSIRRRLGESVRDFVGLTGSQSAGSAWGGWRSLLKNPFFSKVVKPINKLLNLGAGQVSGNGCIAHALALADKPEGEPVSCL